MNRNWVDVQSVAHQIQTVSMSPRVCCSAVSGGTLSAMRYLTSCPLPRLLAFQLSASALQELSNLTEVYLMTQLERGFSTLDFYKSILPQQEANL